MTRVKFACAFADVFLMSASLAVVAVGHPSPVWLGREAVVLTPVRLPAFHSARLDPDRDILGTRFGRGDAVSGRFVMDDAKGSSASAAFASTLLRDDGSVLASYLLWSSFCASNGRVVNYYA